MPGRRTAVAATSAMAIAILCIAAYFATSHFFDLPARTDQPLADTRFEIYKRHYVVMEILGAVATFAGLGGCGAGVVAATRSAAASRRTATVVAVVSLSCAVVGIALTGWAWFSQGFAPP